MNFLDRLLLIGGPGQDKFEKLKLSPAKVVKLYILMIVFLAGCSILPKINGKEVVKHRGFSSLKYINDVNVCRIHSSDIERCMRRHGYDFRLRDLDEEYSEEEDQSHHKEKQHDPHQEQQHHDPQEQHRDHHYHLHEDDDGFYHVHDHHEDDDDFEDEDEDEDEDD